MAKLAALDKMVLVTGGLVVLVVAGVSLSALNSLRVGPGEAKASAQLYKNPNCNCCDGYAAYLRDHGYAVTTTPTHNLSLIRREHGVPGRLAGCHTTIVAGYVVEGHVPARGAPEDKRHLFPACPTARTACPASSATRSRSTRSPAGRRTDRQECTRANEKGPAPNDRASWP